MNIFQFLVFLIITIFCLIPFGVAMFYFILGIRSLWLGRQENSSIKTAGGYCTIIISFLSMIAIYFLWLWLK